MRWFFLLAVAHLALTATAFSQGKRVVRDIRQVDFRNFVYPWITQTTPGDFGWITDFFDTSVSFRDGLHRFKDQDCGGPYQPCPYASISQIFYTDVNDDDTQDAVVVLNYKSSGTAYWQYVYMYTVEKDAVKLIAAFETGDRSDHGLHRVYAGNGHLVVELNEPDENQGLCCAAWRTRTEYEWRKDHFEAVSEPVKEPIPIYERTWYLAR